MSALLAATVLLSPALVPQSAPTQTYTVEAPGMQGMATLQESINRDGSKRVFLTLELKALGSTVKVLQEAIYDKNGRPVRKLQRTENDSGEVLRSVTADFRQDQVEIRTASVDGQPALTTLPYPQKSIEAKHEFWFRRDNPARGAKHTYMHLDLGKGFVETTAEYVGRLEMTVLGEKKMAHYVRVGETKSYFDEDGTLLALESPQLNLRLTEPDLSD